MTSEARIEGWDEEVELRLVVKVRVRPNPALFEGWMERTPAGLAQTAIYAGLSDPAQIDGYADLLGEVRIDSIEEW